VFSMFASAAFGQLNPAIRLTPPSVAVGSGDLKLTIAGTQFAPSYQLFWNGQARSTQFLDSHRLKAAIAASDLAKPGLVKIQLVNSNTGVAVSDALWFLIYVPLRANDLIYDNQRSLVYVSVSSKDPNGPSVAVTQPETGFVQRYIPVPSEPGVLAISDNSEYLYVALKDRVRRMDLTGSGSELDILFSSLPQLFGGGVTSMLPLPSQGSSVLISFGNETFVVDGSRPRSDHTNLGPNCLVGSPDGTTIYGSSSSIFIELTLGSTGLTSHHNRRPLC
jgi:hypothetical protein